MKVASRRESARYFQQTYQVSERRAGELEKREVQWRARLDRDRRAHVDDVRRCNPRRADELEARWFSAA